MSYKIHQYFNMTCKTYEDFLSLGVNSLKSYLNVRSVAKQSFVKD